MELDKYIEHQKAKLASFDDFALSLMLKESNSLLSETKQALREKGVPGAEYSPGYSAYRAKRGRQTAKVDLTFTNRMLNNTQVNKVLPTGQTELTAFIGPSQQRERDKFKKNMRRYGNFLKVNDAQRKRFQKRYIQAITKYISD